MEFKSITFGQQRSMRCPPIPAKGQMRPVWPNVSAHSIIDRAHREDFTNVKLLDEALPPYRPVSPNIRLVLTLFGGSGTLLILIGGILLFLHSLAKRKSSKIVAKP